VLEKPPAMWRSHCPIKFYGNSKITLFSKGPYPSYDPGTMKFSKESPKNPADNLIARHIDLTEDRADDLEFLRGLYPDLNNDKLLEVKERLDGYFEVVLQVFLEKYPKGSIDDSLKSS
jgi:hypothetical protein